MLPECFALSAPRRHVDLDVGWMLSEPLPHPPLLFALIKASGVKEVTEHKVKSELIMSVNVEGFSIRGRDGWGGGGAEQICMSKREGKEGSRTFRRVGEKREEDAFAAAWFTDCTVAMETFVSPLFDPKWESKQWCHSLILGGRWGWWRVGRFEGLLTKIPSP